MLLNEMAKPHGHQKYVRHEDVPPIGLSSLIRSRLFEKNIAFITKSPTASSSVVLQMTSEVGKPTTSPSLTEENKHAHPLN